MKKFRNRLIGFAIATILMGGSVVSAQAKQIGSIDGHPIFDNHYEDIKIATMPRESSYYLGANFPAKYDPREFGGVTAIENQGNTNSCWAFSTIAAAECNLIKKGLANQTINLSENHLAYFYYHRETDPLGYTAGDRVTSNYRYANNSEYAAWVMSGGSLVSAATHLATWSGLTNQTSLENYTGGVYAPTSENPYGLQSTDCYKNDYKVKNSYFYQKPDANTIKEAVMNYGAMAIGICISENYYQPETAGYYAPYGRANHGVTIVGWDDNYSLENFAVKPERNGAWIVKNSYGSSFGDGGYIYVSYEDATLAQGVVLDMEVGTACNTNNYQYDGNPIVGPVIKLQEDNLIANVFTAKAASGYNELLKAVSINTYTEGVNYKLKVYTGLTSSGNPTSGKLITKSQKEGTLMAAGYHRITLDTPITLEAGEQYAVVFELETPYQGETWIGIDRTYINQPGMYDTNVDYSSATMKNQSYILLKGKWQDIGTELYANFRIKAYTDNANEKTKYNLSKSLSISKGSSTTLKLQVNPSSIQRKVKWSSSNKKVATISSSGKIKAKSYGVTTVKAKFVAGSKTKTLSCKVTVGPSKLKNFKISSGKKKIHVKWKKNSDAKGYTICYAKSKSGKYKTLATINSGSKTSYTKKMKKGTYYVKMRPFTKKGSKKLYGSYTSVKKVKVK